MNIKTAEFELVGLINHVSDTGVIVAPYNLHNNHSLEPTMAARLRSLDILFQPSLECNSVWLYGAFE